jgi:hypothetical protein
MSVGQFLIRAVDGDRPYQPAKEGDIIKNPGAISGHAKTITNADSTYGVQLSDQIILVDETGGAVTVELPSPTYEGETYLIKQITGGANNTTVQTADSATIDGSATQSIAAQWDFIEVVSDGTDYFITAN